MCQRPRKTCGTQVCYLQELLSHHFNTSYLYNYCSNFYKIYIFYAPIYTTLHNKFEENRISSLEDMCTSNFLPIFFFFTPIYNNNFEPKKQPSPGWISYKFCTLIKHILACLQRTVGDV